MYYFNRVLLYYIFLKEHYFILRIINVNSEKILQINTKTFFSMDLSNIAD